MPDPNENYNRGLRGEAPPSSGGFDQWAAGDAARRLQAQALAQNQQAMSSPVAVPEYVPVRAPIVQFNFVNTPREEGRKVPPLLAFPLLVVVGVPLYHYSIPLWMALYPGAAAIAVGIALLVFLGLGSGGEVTLEGRLVVGGIFAFVAAWPLTLAELSRASNKSYRHTRHTVRLALLFLWAVYSLSVRELHPDVGFPPLKDVWAVAWTPVHFLIAGLVVVAMHFWLATDRPRRIQRTPAPR